VGWSYPNPLSGAEAIANCIAFYPTHLNCTVAGERVTPQPGGFYGGWITLELVGPFKGEVGTRVGSALKRLPQIGHLSITCSTNPTTPI